MHKKLIIYIYGGRTICWLLLPADTMAGMYTTGAVTTGLRDLNMASATSLAASNSKRQRRAMPAACSDLAGFLAFGVP